MAVVHHGRSLNMPPTLNYVCFRHPSCWISAQLEQIPFFQHGKINLAELSCAGRQMMFNDIGENINPAL
jgi:hypothetical protein